MLLELISLYLYAYLAGSIPSSYLVGRIAKNIDIREYGSGNVGGTNVLRHVGKWWASSSILFEVFIKGISPIWAGFYVFGINDTSLHWVSLTLLAIAGHNWSIFLKFSGGRGIAVATGILLGIAPVQLVIFLITYLTGWFATKNSGVWVLISLVSLPVWTLLLGKSLDAVNSIWPLQSGNSTTITWCCFGIVCITILKRLLSNWERPAKNLQLRTLILNRLFLDRDTKDRHNWVNRQPPNAEGE